MQGIKTSINIKTHWECGVIIIKNGDTTQIKIIKTGIKVLD